MRISSLDWSPQTGTAQYASFSPHLYYGPEELFGDDFGTVSRHGQGNILIPTPPEDYSSEVFGLGDLEGKTAKIAIAVISAGGIAGGVYLLLKSISTVGNVAGTILIVAGSVGLRLSLRNLLKSSPPSSGFNPF